MVMAMVKLMIMVMREKKTKIWPEEMMKRREKSAVDQPNSKTNGRKGIEEHFASGIYAIHNNTPLV